MLQGTSWVTNGTSESPPGLPPSRNSHISDISRSHTIDLNAVAEGWNIPATLQRHLSAPKKNHLCMSETSAPCCSFHVCSQMWFPKNSQWKVEQTLHREAVTSCFLSNSNHSIKAFMVGTMNEAINWPLVLGKGQQVVNWLGSWMCSEAGTEINPPFLWSIILIINKSNTKNEGRETFPPKVSPHSRFVMDPHEPVWMLESSPFLCLVSGSSF